MKKFLVMFVALLLTASPAMADHHRGHALTRIDSVLVDLNKIQEHIDYAEANCHSTGLDYENNAHWNTFRFYTGSNIATLENIKGNLENGGPEVLETLRRQMNMPSEALPISYIWKEQVQLQALFQIKESYFPGGAYSGDVCARKMWNAIYRQISTLRVGAQILWHINDAIREEVYEDPTFICAGSGNHC